ncbi:alpha/beta hydrolase [Waterburya agarophytonicola K14]|uniref:Alpha/beta hydrolase n=1 Tax=Waterburya agarophytonicola KI4 TaxID=2874699 RepID=A0A964FMB2_9CYAN|nr:alpha/beta hydrolase [Waterburya agarophytonicola]MCC0179788.1 alpha/beta hydrolase [Waterburya agarophytonicola KI4]
MIKPLISLILGISTALLSISATAAERIAFSFSFFGEFYIQVEDLDTFIKTGKISKELAYYLNRLPPEQVARLSELLSTPVDFNPLTIAKFSNSTVGEIVIKNIGKGIRTKTNRNGFFALRSAIIAAAFDSQGLTIINLLHEFPLETIYVDISVLDRYIDRGRAILENRQAVDNIFFQKIINTSDFREIEADLFQSGQYTWQKKTLTYENPHRKQAGYFDLYLPQKKRSSLIIISHGVASNRQTFDYLGEHLASHGFSVAIVEHDNISLNKFDRFLSGKESFPKPNNLISQPLDITYLLDSLEQESKLNSALQNKIDLQQVGIIGHSFGGYTSLALAGGKLIADSESGKCQTEDYQNVLLDLSSLAKCTFNNFSSVDRQLKDPRIKAAIAINPMAGIFGRKGISSINIPTMFISGTHDLFMPPLTEQIQPFSWLNEDIDKYLVLVKPGTHFSFLREGLGVLPVPDDIVGISPSQAYPAIEALTTIFFKAHLDRQPKYIKYLESDSLKLIDLDAFQLSIMRSISNIQLQQLLKNSQE